MDLHHSSERARPCFRLPVEFVSRDGSEALALASLLPTAWEDGVRSGIVAYDPALTERLVADPFRYHLLPARAHRPGAAKPPHPAGEGLRLPHAPCPFDDPELVSEREFARVERCGRPYHLTCNRYPVTPHHFLVVRPAAAPAELLPQCVHGPEDLEDLFSVLRAAGPCFRGYFNSNRGADGSQSGSSVNHWHFQLLRYPPQMPSPFRDAPIRTLREDGGIRIGEIEGWPARHTLFEGDFAQAPRAYSLLWEKLHRLNEANVAYNLEVSHRGTNAYRAALFARCPGPDMEVPGTGRLSPDFGGWELSGDIVIPSRQIFDWARAHPEEAARMTAERLRETTRPLP